MVLFDFARFTGFRVSNNGANKYDNQTANFSSIVDNTKDI